MTDYLERVNELEQHFIKVGRDCVLLAKDGDALRELLNKSVWGTLDFKALPKRSQTFVHGYVMGAAAMCSIEQDAPSVEPPDEVKTLQSTATWRRHANGGGWVSSTALVEDTALVGSRAVVYGNAKVLDRARVFGSARICGRAEISGAAHVHGRSLVKGHAKVFDAAKVLGDAVVEGSAQIGGTSVVRGEAVVDMGKVIDGYITDVAPPRRSDVRELRPSFSPRLAAANNS